MKKVAKNHASRACWRLWLLYGSASLLGMIILTSFWLAASASRTKTTNYYTSYDLSRPWFDGKSWDWFLDMFNMPHLKPQEEGTLQTFPTESVPRSGREPFIPAKALSNGRLLRNVQPRNTLPITKDSVERGKILYGRYCAVCHGVYGNADTIVVKRGMPAPPLHQLLTLLSDAHIYNLIRYGGGIMPSYAHQTTPTDRWEIIHYLRSERF